MSALELACAGGDTVLEALGGPATV